MGELMPALVTVGVGLALLVILLLVAVRPVRRFARANSALRAGVTRGMAPLQALLDSRRR